jgi:hypothetical protein
VKRKPIALADYLDTLAHGGKVPLDVLLVMAEMAAAHAGFRAAFIAALSRKEPCHV